MSHGGHRAGAGRPRKYTTQEEVRAARREQDRQRHIEERKHRIIRIEPDEPPPPIEVVLERRHREELRKLHRAFEVPPPSYSANYYVKAWRTQRRIARGQSV